MDELEVDEEQDARGMNDENAENEMFNIMALSLVIGIMTSCCLETVAV
jgi:hypothetical protein